MRIGIFGGAFDPVHNGHLLLAECCREQCELDQVWFVPTRTPPHKDADSLTPAGDRVDMLQLATAGMPEFVISRLELDREGVSWTVETLQQIHESNPDDELFLMIGADSLRDLPTWRDPETIARLATIAAVNRGPAPVEPFAESIPDTIRTRVAFVSMPALEISSTDIRSRIATGKSIRFLVPRAVEEVIRQRGFYK